MNARSGILSGGNWIVDKLKLIDTYPQQDALANITGQSISNGGAPFNVLVDLAKLGAPFPLEAIGLVGNDADGQWIHECCQANQIGTEQLRTHESAPTSYTDVMVVRSTARRTFFHQRGANALLGDSHFDFNRTSARLFHLGYLLLLDLLDEPDSEFGTVAARVLARARAAGLKTSVDVVSEDSQRFASVVLPALPQVDYCVLNEFELERTTGIPTRPDGNIDGGAIRRASEQLLNAGVREWVIVHFPEGATALGANGTFCHQPSLQLPQGIIVSTVGAGDAFAAGVLLGLHEGVKIQDALEYGVTAAASCLFGAGTSEHLMSLADCLALKRKFGFREEITIV